MPTHVICNRRSRAAVFDNLQLGLEATSPTLTLVLTPAHLHAEHSVEACRHNSHVLCEKPMAMTAADCEKMITLPRSISAF